MISKLPDEHIPGTATSGVGGSASSVSIKPSTTLSIQIRLASGPSIRPAPNGPDANVLPGGIQGGVKVGIKGETGLRTGLATHAGRSGRIRSKAGNGERTEADRGRARTAHALLDSRIAIFKRDPEFRDDVLKQTTSLIGSQCAWDDALQFVEKLRHAGIAPNSHVYGALLSRAEQERLPDQVLSIFERLQADRISINPILCMPVIAALGQLGRPDEALALLRELEQQDARGPDLRIYAAVMSAYARQVSPADQAAPVTRPIHAGDLSASSTPDALTRVEQLHDELLSRGLAPDARITGTRLMAQARAGQLDAAFALFDQLLARPQPPHISVCNALLSACDRAGDATRALRVFHTMIERDTPPNSVSFAALMRACVGASDSKSLMAAMQASVDIRLLQPLAGYNREHDVLSLEAIDLLHNETHWRRVSSGLPEVGAAVAAFHLAQGRLTARTQVQGPAPAVRGAQQAIRLAR